MIKLLKWDTDFFGFKIGEVQGHPNLQEAKEQGYKLIYVKSKEAIQLDAFKDHKIIFKKELKHLQQTSSQVKSILGSKLTPDLLELALTAGHQSRFKLDKNFKNNEFEKLYTEWLRKSLSGELADDVLGYFEDSKCLGFITVKIIESEATIGLMVISPDSQGKGLGGILTTAAENNAISKGAKTAYVSTQFSNDGACRFYMKNGYSKYNEELTYHLWTNI